MQRLLTLLLLLGISTIVRGVSDAKFFRCTRAQQQCPSPSTCNTDEDGCDNCPTGKFGYACHLAADVKATQDNCPCQNGGKCLTDDTCGCTPKYTGDKCQDFRISLDCGDDPPTDASVMKLDIANLIGIGSNNDGKAQIIVEGADSSTAEDAPCFGNVANTFLEVNNVFTTTGMSAACLKATKTTFSGSDEYARKFIVRFLQGTTTSLTDFRVTATCAKGGGILTITSDSFSTKADVSTELKNEDMGESAAGGVVNVALTTGGNPLTDGVQYSLTTEMTVTLTLDKTKPSQDEFTAIRLEGFTVDNEGDDGDTLRSLELMKDGCGTDFERLVIKEKVKMSNGARDELVLVTLPVILDGKMTNRYTLMVKLCKKDEESKCDMKTCAKRRRRRDVGADEYATLGVGFNVRDQVQRITDLRNEMKNEKECVLTTEITASLVAMAVAILLLLVLVIILSVRAILAHRRDVTVYERHQMETASTTSLPKMVNGGY